SAPMAFAADAQAVASGEKSSFFRWSEKTGTHAPKIAKARKISIDSRAARKAGSASTSHPCGSAVSGVLVSAVMAARDIPRPRSEEADFMDTLRLNQEIVIMVNINRGSSS